MENKLFVSSLQGQFTALEQQHQAVVKLFVSSLQGQFTAENSHKYIKFGCSYPHCKDSLQLTGNTISAAVCCSYPHCKDSLQHVVGGYSSSELFVSSLQGQFTAKKNGNKHHFQGCSYPHCKDSLQQIPLNSSYRYSCSYPHCKDSLQLITWYPSHQTRCSYPHCKDSLQRFDYLGNP